MEVEKERTLESRESKSETEGERREWKRRQRIVSLRASKLSRAALTYTNHRARSLTTDIESRLGPPRLTDKPITRLRCVARRSDGAEVLTGECVVYTMRPG